MKRMICVLFAAITLTCFAQDDLGITCEGDVILKGQIYGQKVDKATSSKQPSWDPLKEKCPMDPGKAIQLAVEKLKKDIPSAAHLKPTGVSLNKASDTKNIWFYMVFLHEKRDEPESDFAEIIVCLDGTVPPFEKAKMQKE